MPTFKGSLNQDNQIMIKVWVDKSKKGLQSYKGLVDTGASHTCISKKVVDDFNLDPEGQRLVSTPTGDVPVFLYSINFYLAISKTSWYINKQGLRRKKPKTSWFTKKNLEVSMLKNENIDFDVLIGMDVVSKLSLNIFNKDFYISF